MPQTRWAVVNGVRVKQVQLQSNWYCPVASRIQIANEADAATIRTGSGYRVTEHQILPVGDRWAYTCVVEFPLGSGATYPGSDFIDVKDAAGLAKAETSAVGRALGLAGLAIDEGIASAEEMRRVRPDDQRREPSREPERAPSREAPREDAPAAPTPYVPAVALTGLAARLGRHYAGMEKATAMRDAAVLLKDVLKRPVTVADLQDGSARLTPVQVAAVFQRIEEVERVREATPQATPQAAPAGSH